MTEENHTPESAPASNEAPPEVSDETPQVPEPGPDAPLEPPVGYEPPAAKSPFDPPQAVEEDPPAPPSSPAPWPPSEQEFLSPEEDEALREQRARRYGGQDEAQPSQGDASAARGEESTGPATQVFSPDSLEDEAVHPGGPAPMVTPIPAAPAGPAYADPAAHGPETGTHAPTTQLPSPPAPAPTAPEQGDAFEELDEGPVSRAAAHWWTILITLVFAPVAWYLFTDGGARIEWAGSQGQPIPVAAYIEFGLGLLAVFIFLLAARWSSLGSIIMGALFFALGVAFLIFPGEGGRILMQSTEYFGRLGQFGINVVEHLGITLETGRMALYGLVMIMVGVVSHGARRQGRREERTKIALGE